MKWIGLTGGIGSGKSAASSCFSKLGVPVLDADKLAKKVVDIGTPGLALVVNEFGNEMLRHDQSLDREKLGKTVFSQPEKLQKLESIIHPLVQQEIRKARAELEGQGHLYAIYDVPLLYEKNLSGFDAVIVVDCSLQNRIERLQRRNQWPLNEIHQRINAQIPLAEKVQRANYVIDNNGDQQALERAVVELHKLLASRS